MSEYCYGCMEEMDEKETVCQKCGFDISKYETEPHQLPPGTVVNGRYMLGRVIGEGGFGITYVGVDNVLGLKVAVKEFYMSGYVNRNCTSSTRVVASVGTHAETFEKNRERFLDEARVLAKFANEDGIVGIRDYFVENNTAYIVMDFLAGETLKSKLEHSGNKMSWNEVMTTLAPVMKSLNEVHKHNIIHRDISPDNIMITNDGRVKLLDFGAAREISQKDIKSLSVILKPGYAPEEQYRSKGNQGPWTDVYSIAATIYRCITGNVPDDSMERMFDDNVIPPHKNGADCTAAQSSVLMKALAVRQADRYASLEEFLTDVKNAEGDPDNENFVQISKAEKTIGVSSNKQSNVTSEAGDSTVYVGRESKTINTNTDATVLVTDSKTAGTVVSANKADLVSPHREQPQKENIKQGNTDKKTVKKSPKKKKLFLAIGIPVAAVILGIIILVISVVSKIMKENPSGQMPDLLKTYSFELNGKKVSVPTTFDELNKLGWITEDGSELTDKVKANQTYSSGVTLTNGYGTINAYYINPTSNILEISQCPIVELKITNYSFNKKVPGNENGDKNSAIFPENVKIGETTLPKFVNLYPKGYGTKKEKYISYVYTTLRYEEQMEKYKNKFEFVFTDSTLESVEIANYDTSSLIENTYSKKNPNYDLSSMEEKSEYKWTIKYCGFEFGGFFTPDDLMKEGWTFESAPEYVPGQSSAEVSMRFDKLTTMTIEVYNPTEKALIPRYCIVSSFNTSSIKTTDKARETDFCLENNGLIINEGDNISSVLDRLNINMDSKKYYIDTSSSYTYCYIGKIANTGLKSEDYEIYVSGSDTNGVSTFGVTLASAIQMSYDSIGG